MQLAISDTMDDIDPGLKAVWRRLEDNAICLRPLSTKSELADALNVTKQALTGWRQVPVKHVLEIERLLGVRRYEQRPDIYPTPSRVLNRQRRGGRTKI